MSACYAIGILIKLLLKVDAASETEVQSLCYHI